MAAYSKEESKKMFLKSIKELVTYWVNEPRAKTAQEKCNGVVHSILVLIDGGSMNMPSFDLALHPHPDDKEYLESKGEKYHVKGLVINDDVQLHEEWRNVK